MAFKYLCRLFGLIFLLLLAFHSGPDGVSVKLAWDIVKCETFQLLSKEQYWSFYHLSSGSYQSCWVELKRQLEPMLIILRWVHTIHALDPIYFSGIVSPHRHVCSRN